jgi:hypothetical protein
MSNDQTPKINLDWSRLLGFDQATPGCADASAIPLIDPRLAKLGLKPGSKGGFRQPI